MLSEIPSFAFEVTLCLPAARSRAPRSAPVTLNSSAR